jgi:glutaredoxin
VSGALVELYGRRGCHLCDEARAALARLAADHAFELIEHDIDSDEAWLRTYLERIPVIAVDGEELCDFRIDERLLRARLPRRIASDDLESG